jgi:hypothetical protein
LIDKIPFVLIPHWKIDKIDEMINDLLDLVYLKHIIIKTTKTRDNLWSFYYGEENGKLH